MLLSGGIHRSRLTGAWRRRNKRTSGSLQLRLGINQEVGRGDDLFVRLETFTDYNFVSDLRPELNFPRLDVAFALIHKDQIPRSRMKCRGGRHNQLTAHRQFYANVCVHSRSQLQSRVRKHQAYRQRARAHVELWEDVLHTTVEHSARIRIHRDFSGIARLDLSRVALEHLRQYPDIGKISHGVQHRFRLHVHVGQSFLVSDVARDRGIDGEVCNCLSVLV